ncbi:uncharacterized protein LOC135696911 [Ochlerotatus camptorhynchus]|uniref:uncharacterized protein LOC135696911 n=1 Tax=Ochlerotatus camptorhynchus TaxID=644619 RepID=UPI0031D0308B
MARKRTTASKKRVLQLSNERNSEFLLNEIPESRKSSRSCMLSGEPDSKKPSLSKGMQNDVKSGEDEPQPGPSKPRESRVEQTATDFEETSGESDIENDLYGCNDDDDDELEETMNGLTSDQQMKINSECSCDLTEEVAKLKAENHKFRKQNNFLKKRKINLERSHSKLQQALVSKLLPSTHKPFKKINGFSECPTADMILKMSMVAKDSDYIFVKLLMYAIWPEGFAGRSVTGRTSNNPKGRGKKNQQPIDDDPTDANNNTIPGRTVLEVNKVKFVNGNV